GLPVATKARPSVQRRRSSGVASAWLVGFESGRMSGRLTPAAIARTAPSVSAPGCPQTPMRTVGGQTSDHRLQIARAVHPACAGHVAGPREAPLGSVQPWRVTQGEAVDLPEA